MHSDIQSSASPILQAHLVLESRRTFRLTLCWTRVKFDESSRSGENRKVVPTTVWACGAVGSALPWHGRGHRFDPDQVHQLFQSFRSTSLLPLVGNLGANSKTTPRTGFAGDATARAVVSSAIALGLRARSSLAKLFVAFAVRGVLGGSGSGALPAFFDNSA